MQQWIPRTQTLEPKIWVRSVSGRGLYMGLDVFAGIFFLIALVPFGIGPRIAAALLALAAGVAAGFIKIKGLSPERYLFHRLRFAFLRQGLRLWEVPETTQSFVAPRSRPQAKRLDVASNQTSAPSQARPRQATPTRATPTSTWSECMVQASPFALGFYLLALGVMGVAILYATRLPVG